MKNFYTAYEVLVNKGSFNSDSYEMEHFENEFIDKCFNAFKVFVSRSARGSRRERIMRSGLDSVKHWGILSRLWYYPETGKVEYCCGQDWDSEMATLRDCFDRRV